MRRAAFTGAVLGLLAAFGASTAAAAPQDPVSLTPASAKPFPDRSFRLAVPARRGLTLRDLQVTENGERVDALSLSSADGGGVGEFGAILVIDASTSMRGRAIRSAVDAARALARQRRGAQQLGVIAFNKSVDVLLPPTSDPRAIEAALSKPPALGPQTYTFDAVDRALDELERAAISAGSIVVLSDGGDTGSATAAAAVAQRARKANISIFTVGLRSGSINAKKINSSALQALAAAGRGRYTDAEAGEDLRRVFRDIGVQLSSDYLINYRSFARPGRDVSVAVRVTGIDGVATSTYRVPGDASFVQIEDSFWTSGLGAGLTALASALLLALGLGILLVRRGQGPGLRERVGGFVSSPQDLSAAASTDTALTERGPGSAERSLERTRWWIAFKRDVEIARIEVEPMKIVTWTALATFALMYLLAKISGIPLVGIFALAIPWGMRTWVGIQLERRRDQFTEQLPDILQAAASAIRAGHGLVAALAMVAEDAPEPSRTELLRVVSDEGLGVPLDEALRVVQHRMESRDVMQIALVAQIQREAGGNMAEVLDRITESLRQRAELRRMVKALTAQGRLSRWVVTALPLVLLLVISVLNPTYIRPLFTETLGFVMLAMAGVMMFLGSMVIGKIVNFKV